MAKAIFGQQAGAAAVIMVNDRPGLPAVRGPITIDPDTGASFTVTIPFLGVWGRTTRRSSSALTAARRHSRRRTQANPGLRDLASFSSFGPRSGDSGPEAERHRSGVGIVSAGMGTGIGR